MNMDDLAWAQADLSHASTLKEQAVNSAGTTFSESWESQGYVWSLYGRQDTTRTPQGEILRGLWDFRLRAQRSGETWAFAPTADGWFASEHKLGF
jgi:hypothetical protein